MNGQKWSQSGVWTVDLEMVAVERRRELVTAGVESGRWTYEMGLAAHCLAVRPRLPPTDDGWCALLDRLQPAMIDAVARACVEPCDEFIGYEQ